MFALHENNTVSNATNKAIANRWNRFRSGNLDFKELLVHPIHIAHMLEKCRKLTCIERSIHTATQLWKNAQQPSYCCCVHVDLLTMTMPMTTDNGDKRTVPDCVDELFPPV